MIFLSLKNGKVTNREKSSVASCPSRFFLKISNIIKSYAISVTAYYWCYGIWGKNGRKERIQKTNLHIYVNLIYGRGGIVEYWRKEMLLNKCFGKLRIHVKRKKKRQWFPNITQRNKFQTNQTLKCHSQNFKIYRNYMLNV